MTETLPLAPVGKAAASSAPLQFPPLLPESAANTPPGPVAPAPAKQARSARRRGGARAAGTAPVNAPDWYKDAVIYELHVRSFHDANGDGVGDFRGLTEKLDYLQRLGVTALWLLPFYPSPLRDDGYDIADYTGVQPAYGTLSDFKAFLREAHRRGLKVITELVLNHTSDQHPWFQRARRSPPGSPQREFYVWSETPQKYSEARIIFQDFETSNWTWDPVANAYYWHRFYSHQPDLNFENPAVRRAMLRVVDFWFGLGVDGLRLDAVPYLFERDGTNCENLPETHGFLKELRGHVDRHHPGRMLLAEANQWPEDAARYFGDGDECHMAFHFPVMPRLYMALRTEDRFPVVDILQQTPPIPDSAQWAIFLRNHDELTLEMVTDEERDSMVRFYATDPQARINLGIRRRLAPLLGNDRRRIELMHGLLLSLPGTPVLYYGDELGMGDNIYLGDRNGVRTPMQWSADRNAGFSRTNPQRLFLPPVIDPEYHYEALNVEAQSGNPNSLLWWTSRMVALRKRYTAFGRGTLEFLEPENRKVFAFVRRHGAQAILVVANLSRYAQYAELDLKGFAGHRPMELVGLSEFPPLADGKPFGVTLGAHQFFWFLLAPPRPEPETRDASPPRLRVAGLSALLAGNEWPALADALPDRLRGMRWFRGKARTIKTVDVVDAIPTTKEPLGGIVLVRVEYAQGDPETYLLPMVEFTGAKAAELREKDPAAVIAVLDAPDAILAEGLGDATFCSTLLSDVAKRRKRKGRHGLLAAQPTRAFVANGTGKGLEPEHFKGEQTNSTVRFGDQYVLKLFRSIEPGPNPDVELGRYLTEIVPYPHIPPVAGVFEYTPDGGKPLHAGILHRYVQHQSDCWQFTLDHLNRYLERGLAFRESPPPTPKGNLLQDKTNPPPQVAELLGRYLQLAPLLGVRTAEMHLALARGSTTDFVPEPFTRLGQRALYQAMRSQAIETLGLLRNRSKTLPDAEREAAERLLARRADVIACFQPLLARQFPAKRSRIHGDFHLGQVLFTGRDVVILDFEGEPARPLGERRLKRSPLRDVAGMLRSFHYAAEVALRSPRLPPGMGSALKPWARFWVRAVSSAYLQAYLGVARPAGVVPERDEDVRDLLKALLAEKAIYELGYELNNRPAWVGVPIASLLEMLDNDV